MDFNQLVTTRLPALLRHATVLTGDPHLAEDIVQDVLLRAQQRWARIGSPDYPEAYLRRMIVNELMSVRRRVQARLRRERGQYPAAPADRSEQIAQRDALVRQIKALPSRQRIVIALRYFEDLSDVEIAQAMGCTVGTVRSHASRALATLRCEAATEYTMESK